MRFVAYKTIFASLLLTTFLTTSHFALAEDKKEQAEPAPIDAKTYELLNLFGDVFERVRENYVESVPDKKLIENALNGMLAALDPHSGYLDETNFEDMKVQTKGEFGGLGIEVTMDGGLVKVVSPIDDTPAARAGIKPGDMIIKIGKEEVSGLSLSDAVDKMRGPIGSSLDLTIIRKGKSEPFTIKLQRAVIKVQSTRSRLINDDVGYIRITSFNEQVQSGLEKAIVELKKNTTDKDGKSKLKGYILDMRNNPGGLLEQAVSVSDSFLERGEIVSTRGRRPEEIERVNAVKGDLIDGLPLVVLINEGSASASEIVAGALQDHRRAIVMGQKSFGKGSVQTIISLPGHGAMRLTTARYYTPSGRSIQSEGIVPDIEVKQAKIEEIENKFADLMSSESNLRGALKNDTDYKAGKEDAEMSKEDLEVDKDKKDYQLQRAADLIRGVARYTTKVPQQ
jgi:carboxyl-terminal processing protease